jgi:hypothetical protein
MSRGGTVCLRFKNITMFLMFIEQDTKLLLMHDFMN